GYECCSHCNNIYEDEDGQWGVENGQWCGIPEQCSEEETCWALKEGYPCCDHCVIVSEDETGLWGIMNGKWCGIPTRCNP
ncbi:Non-catalytic module family DOC2, partial [Piromyces sp. E2]